MAPIATGSHSQENESSTADGPAQYCTEEPRQFYLVREVGMYEVIPGAHARQ